MMRLLSQISAVMPAHAGIQYAAALAIERLTLWNTGPACAGMTAELKGNSTALALSPFLNRSCRSRSGLHLARWFAYA
jgi:hypothetical protein